MTDAFLIGLEDRRLKRDTERMALNKRLLQLNAEGEADIVAKRVYLDMVNAGQFPAYQVEEKPPEAPSPDAVEPAPRPAVNAASLHGQVMVKDMILAILRESHPVGLSAAQIKGKAYLRFKQHINPNTLTVTLGRYSKPKPGEPRVARCEGRTWFYIPPSEAPMGRTLDLLNGGKHAAE